MNKTKIIALTLCSTGLLWSCVIGMSNEIKIKDQLYIDTYNELRQLIELSSEKDKEIQDIKDKLQESIDESNNLKEQIEHKDRELKQKDKDIEALQTSVTYNPYNLSESSNATVFHLKRAFKGTNMEGLESAFVKAESLYGINAVFLSSLAILESSWGGSDRAVKQNNLTGYMVYSPTSRGYTFSSKEDNILSTAKLIAHDYLDKDGKYYSGSSIWNVNQKYCLTPNSSPDTTWSQKINSIAYELKDKSKP